MSFKENLKAELEYQDIQLKELAEKTRISKNTLSNYLTGHKSLPAADNAVKIAKALGVTVEYLVTGKSSDENSISSLPIKHRKIIDSLVNLDDTDLDSVLVLIKSLQKRYPSKTITKDTFISELRKIFQRETESGSTEVTITASELHRIAGNYPGENHRIPLCCSAMRELFDEKKDIIISESKKDNNALLTISYALPR